MGKIQRLTRELVAVLVEEFGHEEAARMLEYAAAQARGAAYKHKNATKQEAEPVAHRPRTVARR